MELLLGCGHSREKKIAWRGRSEWDGLVTLDREAACKPDVLHDLDELPYPFEADAFDEIHAYCVLEHCGRQGDWRFFFVQWSEFYRITKPGGTFHGVVPRWDSPWAWGDPSHTRVIGVECLAFLSKKTVAQNRANGTAMTDFSSVYGADWDLLGSENINEHNMAFILRANK